MKGQSYLILALIFALIIAIFAVINVDPVQVNFLFGTGEAPLILVILLSVLLGGLATASVGAVRYFKLKRENRKLHQQLSAKDQEQKEFQSGSIEEDTRTDDAENSASENV
ncbi:lipopolysaccharide assembly protein LapA domain-containing protein [Halobacillus yeomjeoni]|uniref:DUF1049 domain-containing protein n=1 Tax=Halobacillus yeomjeoni TaxID=311194 RepID=A0A931HUI5_9BACI|nr:lipopolysaccharide assembly protein LapA domain-containing protein [Halobacillus yeomjeoni]MBH0229985.1 DUF1049 domain-containing protein [Halobacillus yeomjeoni]MCA0982637.1 lipopolysaccharide assembly protein LapA domain-containing protein [Halobacillus yeomjeoni]